ncbi:MAG: hypothetical protein QGG64_12720, partial [Candidatus Latescibacteria bacterium]|nr:hypothetical protein [Candidatus Latescibacterota bacterium]
EPACPLPLTMMFTQGCDPQGNVHTRPKAFNYLGSTQGPLPRIPFFGQDMTFLEGLGLHLRQYLHPNEVEAAMLTICGDRDTTCQTLRKIKQFSDMLTAP